jgi:glutamyl endopeptidase
MGTSKSASGPPFLTEPDLRETTRTELMPGKRGNLCQAETPDTLEQGFRSVRVDERAPYHKRHRKLGNQRRRISPTAESGQFGDDRRARVNNPQVYPYSAICALRLYYADGQPYGGTGFLVGSRLLLTAGHNLYETAKGWVRKVEIYPALNGSYDGSPCFTPQGSPLTTQEWVNTQDPGYDYGALVLGTDVGNQYGYLPVQKRVDADLPTGLPINTDGYPLDCPQAAAEDCPQQGTTMWQDVGTISHIDGRKIFYSDLYMFNGDSGAPIYVYEPADTGNPYKVIAIHTYLWSMEYSATRINDDVWNMIQLWLQQSGSGSTG